MSVSRSRFSGRDGVTRLPSLMVLLAVAGVVLGAHVLLRPEPLRVEESPSPAPVSRLRRITCPACGGEGQLMLRRSGAAGAGTVRMSSGGVDKPYGCPVCGARGFRDLDMLPEAQICPDCAGMGKRLFDPGARQYVSGKGGQGGVRLTMRPCMRCHSLGWLKNPPAR